MICPTLPFQFTICRELGARGVDIRSATSNNNVNNNENVIEICSPTGENDAGSVLRTLRAN